MAGDELRLSCTFKSTSRDSVVYYGDGTQEEMCFAFVSYYPAMSFAACTQYGKLTICHNETKPEDLRGCTFGFKEEERKVYAQLESVCDTTGKVCTPECLELLTQNPHACLSGDVKLLGEWTFPKYIKPPQGIARQRASRSCDSQIYGNYQVVGMATGHGGNMVLSLGALLVVVALM